MAIDQSNAHFGLIYSVIEHITTPPPHYPVIPYQPSPEHSKNAARALVKMSVNFGYLHLPTVLNALIDSTGATVSVVAVIDRNLEILTRIGCLNPTYVDVYFPRR